MSTHAIGRFAVQTWDEHPYDEQEGTASLTRATVTETYTGDLAGEGHTEMLMVACDDGSARYSTLTRIIGQLGGRSGSFVLQVQGQYADGVARGTWTVVPGSATGDLRGLRGSGGYGPAEDDEHSAATTLDYDFA
jgi:hypothetical protein